MKTEYRVVVEYQNSGIDSDFDAKLRKAAKKDDAGSGYYFGGGVRDICWCTNTKERALTLAGRLRSVLGKRKKVTVYKEEY